jgi:hypothetical protein
LGRRGRDNLLTAVATFQAALDIEPMYAAAYLDGDAYAQLGYGGYLRADDAFPRAKAAASRALELDSIIAEPHATLGYVAMYYTWDWRQPASTAARWCSTPPIPPPTNGMGFFLPPWAASTRRRYTSGAPRPTRCR